MPKTLRSLLKGKFACKPTKDTVSDKQVLLKTVCARIKVHSSAIGPINILAQNVILYNINTQHTQWKEFEVKSENIQLDLQFTFLN